MVMKSLGVDDQEKAFKPCPMCNPEHQAKFIAEINVHFSGVENIDHPGILFFPKVLVCFACGSSRFTIPERELALLARGIDKGNVQRDRTMLSTRHDLAPLKRLNQLQ